MTDFVVTGAGDLMELQRIEIAQISFIKSEFPVIALYIYRSFIDIDYLAVVMPVLR
jgi:hypothetical protein